MTFNFEAQRNVEPEGVRAGAPLRPEGLIAAGQLDEDARARRRALLVGQPNVGKSVVFGALTGTYVTVSNYPGTTVEITRGRAKFGEHHWEVVDTPGTHNLVPMSEDEVVTRDVLVSEAHDALLQVGDAKNLTRTLLLTLQLAELGSPFCLDLNMLDEARARGLAIDLAGLAAELPGVRVNTSTAVAGEGLDALREYLASHTAPGAPGAPATPRQPLACAPVFPDDVEAAIAAVEARLDPALPVAARAIATMLLGGERGVPGALPSVAGEDARAVAREQAQRLARAHGVPTFALLSRLRLARAQAIVRRVQRRTAPEQVGSRAQSRATWGQALAAGASASLVSALAYDGAVARARIPSPVDALANYGFLDVVSRALSRGIASGWTVPGLAFLAAGAAIGALVVRRCGRPRSGVWKLAACFAAGWTAYWVASLAEGIALRVHGAGPVHLGAIVGLASAGLVAWAGDARDAAASNAVGRLATHPRWGVLVLGVVLLLAYKIVGEFGAGTAVDFVENRVFGTTEAAVRVDRPTAPEDLSGGTGEDGAKRLVVQGEGPRRAVVVAQVRSGGVYVTDPAARIDVYAPHAHATALDSAHVAIEGDLAGAEAREWSGHINRAAFAFFAWVGIPLLTAFFVGPYGLVTMGATYAVAIVMPVVATFFFVFSMLEDSGYLPRLAVMSNRTLNSMGLNGRAVLPMVLGLGCDTMATLTARIMETRKERTLVTLLLALAIPCSSQLSVIFALMQRTSAAATLVWVAVVLGTLLGVGWIAARALPGDRSDFLLEMPPIRQPMVGNLVAKTMARIEWYLKEAVPLFLAGTALLFVLDAANLLGFVHRAGEPIVHYVLGFPREGGVADRVSEALLVGFLRRDFGAAGLLDLGRAGRLSPADVAVSMVTITLFIPCIANVFMIAKERGWRAAGAMSGFIFPYAVAVGAVVRLGFRVFGG
jgi:Fe2+ transport system protein B